MCLPSVGLSRFIQLKVGENVTQFLNPSCQIQIYPFAIEAEELKWNDETHSQYLPLQGPIGVQLLKNSNRGLVSTNQSIDVKHSDW